VDRVSADRLAAGFVYTSKDPLSLSVISFIVLAFTEHGFFRLHDPRTTKRRGIGYQIVCYSVWRRVFQSLMVFSETPIS
jgi:hypothetical protein